jgi:endonuclease-3 related protein
VWGPQHWWPAQTRFEVVVGAFLTQNTGWTNVERALANLRRARVLSVAGIRRAPLAELERMLRPSGYFRQKAHRLKSFVAFLDERYGGSLTRMLLQPTDLLREQLLALKGVGPETADSILLYAANHPVCVVDAYTRRILERHSILPGNADYEDIRTLFERALQASPQTFVEKAPIARGAPHDRELHLGPDGKAAATRISRAPWNRQGPGRGAGHTPSAVSLAPRSELAQVYNEMHALIVGVGKNYCAKREPNCAQCPLGGPGFRLQETTAIPQRKRTHERRKKELKKTE